MSLVCRECVNLYGHATRLYILYFRVYGNFNFQNLTADYPTKVKKMGRVFFMRRKCVIKVLMIVIIS